MSGTHDEKKELNVNKKWNLKYIFKKAKLLYFKQSNDYGQIIGSTLDGLQFAPPRFTFLTHPHLHSCSN